MVSLDFMEDLFLSMLLAFCVWIRRCGQGLCVRLLWFRCSCVRCRIYALLCLSILPPAPRGASDAKDSAISTSHILFGVVRIMNGVRRGTWPEFFVVRHLGVS